MEEKKKKIVSYRDLNSWKKGHELVLGIYKVTALFPDEEKYGLVNQLRRAAVSVTSCIAEGFARKTSKEKVQFYMMSQGSLSEINNQLLIARDLGYMSGEDHEVLIALTETTAKIQGGLIKSIKQNGK